MPLKFPVITASITTLVITGIILVNMIVWTILILFVTPPWVKELCRAIRGEEVEKAAEIAFDDAEKFYMIEKRGLDISLKMNS